MTDKTDLTDSITTLLLLNDMSDGKYRTSKHLDGMHNKFWYGCCMKLNWVCIVGMPAGHHRSNVSCDIYEHDEEHDIGYDDPPIPTDSVPLSPLQVLGSELAAIQVFCKSWAVLASHHYPEHTWLQEMHLLQKWLTQMQRRATPIAVWPKYPPN